MNHFMEAICDLKVIRMNISSFQNMFQRCLIWNETYSKRQWLFHDLNRSEIKYLSTGAIPSFAEEQKIAIKYHICQQKNSFAITMNTLIYIIKYKRLLWELVWSETSAFDRYVRDWYHGRRVTWQAIIFARLLGLCSYALLIFNVN